MAGKAARKGRGNSATQQCTAEPYTSLTAPHGQHSRAQHGTARHSISISASGGSRENSVALLRPNGLRPTRPEVVVFFMLRLKREDETERGGSEAFGTSWYVMVKIKIKVELVRSPTIAR
jgi:hypothetical protein